MCCEGMLHLKEGSGPHSATSTTKGPTCKQKETWPRAGNNLWP